MSNKQNQNAYYNRNKNITEPKNNFSDNRYIKYNQSLYDQNLNKYDYPNASEGQTSNNDARSISIDKTPESIRNFTYKIISDTFDPGYPQTITYNLCPQNLSVVFQNGNTHWSRSKGDIFYRISESSRPDVSDCNSCSYIDFTGEYILNWDKSGPKLVSSTNNKITSASFTFSSTANFFEIFLYPNVGNSYVHIRYRIPVRYRYAYSDWAFLESLILTGEMSETEFIKVVNCCPPEQEQN